LRFAREARLDSDQQPLPGQSAEARNFNNLAQQNKGQNSGKESFKTLLEPLMDPRLDPDLALNIRANRDITTANLQPLNCGKNPANSDILHFASDISFCASRYVGA
jgi:hypothetical protein